VVGLEHDDGTGAERVDARPDVACARRRRERIEEDRDSSRFDRERRDLRLPIRALSPVRVRLALQPQTGCDVSHLDCHGRRA
jgi:hypothetical protein